MATAPSLNLEKLKTQLESISEPELIKEFFEELAQDLLELYNQNAELANQTVVEMMQSKDFMQLVNAPQTQSPESTQAKLFFLFQLMSCAPLLQAHFFPGLTDKEATLSLAQSFSLIVEGVEGDSPEEDAIFYSPVGSNLIKAGNEAADLEKERQRRKEEREHAEDVAASKDSSNGLPKPTPMKGPQKL